MTVLGIILVALGLALGIIGAPISIWFAIIGTGSFGLGVLCFMIQSMGPQPHKRHRSRY